MKSMKSVILVLAGVLIAGVIFAFKAEVPKKEYATINYFESTKKATVQIAIGALTEVKTNTSEGGPNEVFFVRTLNNLVLEGLEIRTTDAFLHFDGVRRIIYLERTKP